MIDYTKINSETWDSWAEDGCEYTLPISHEEYEKTNVDNFAVNLTPCITVPHEWFGELKGKKVLGLASGGGQQMPMLSKLGAECTVFDYSDKQLGNGFVISQDYIPRYTTTSSIVFEGVNPGEDPRNTILWSGIGYAPCSYAIPVWVGAQAEIPQCLASKDKQLAPANDLAMELKAVAFPITRGSGKFYLDYLTLRSDIMPEIMKAEDKEISEGDKLKKRMQSKGFDLEAVKAFNQKADKRFEAFRKRMDKVINKKK